MALRKLDWGWRVGDSSRLQQGSCVFCSPVAEPALIQGTSGNESNFLFHRTATIKDLFLSFVSSWLWASSGLSIQVFHFLVKQRMLILDTLFFSLRDGVSGDILWRFLQSFYLTLLSMFDWVFFFSFKLFVKARDMLLSDAHGLSVSCSQRLNHDGIHPDLHSCRCMYTPFTLWLGFVEQNHGVSRHQSFKPSLMLLLTLDIIPSRSESFS